jgi:hypothetical protein
MIPTSSCFELIIESVSKVTMTPAFRSEVVAALDYFKQQALCDLDRRDQPLVIRSRWRELEGKTKGLGLFDEIKKRDEVWRVVRCFVYDAEPSSLLVPVVERAYVKPTSRFHSATPEDFFELLSKEAERAPLLSPDESLALVHGLLFLKASAALPKPKRNTDKIRKVWASVHPTLKKLGLTEEFSRDETMKNRLRLFIENTL